MLVGTDIIEIERIQRALARWGNRFLYRVYTDRERELYADRPASLAARFAAKEAVMKALGARGLGWREIEVLSDAEGKPTVHLYGRAKEKAHALGAQFSLSLSHCRKYALAAVVGWS